MFFFLVIPFQILLSFVFYFFSTACIHSDCRSLWSLFSNCSFLDSVFRFFLVLPCIFSMQLSYLTCFFLSTIISFYLVPWQQFSKRRVIHLFHFKFSQFKLPFSVSLQYFHADKFIFRQLLTRSLHNSANAKDKSKQLAGKNKRYHLFTILGAKALLL